MFQEAFFFKKKKGEMLNNCRKIQGFLLPLCTR
jgi:hypothetical protein